MREKSALRHDFTFCPLASQPKQDGFHNLRTLGQPLSMQPNGSDPGGPVMDLKGETDMSASRSLAFPDLALLYPPSLTLYNIHIYFIHIIYIYIFKKEAQ